MDIEEKKFLGTAAVERLIANTREEIAAGDEATLSAAKKHAEDLGVLYDPAGTAQTKVDELAKGAVKTNTEAITTLNGEDAGKSVREIANEELAAQLIGENAKESLDTLTEIAAWIQSHPDDASAMNEAIAALQKQLSGIDAGEGTVKKYIDDAIVALSIGDYAKAADLTALAARVTTAEGKITALEESVAGLGDMAAKDIVSEADLDAALAEKVNAAAEGNHAHLNKDVLDGVTAEKVAAWDAAEQNAKNHADALDEAMDARVKVVEEKDHEHANKDVIDGITAEKVAAWDAAEINAKTHATDLNTAMDNRMKVVEEKAHTHENAAELNKIADGDVAKWNAAQANAEATAAADATAKANQALADAKAYADIAEADANTYTDQKVAAIDLSGIETNASDIDKLEASLAEGGATANAIADAKKAGTDASDAVTSLENGKVADLRTDVDALKAVSYVEITADEIDAMFETA